MQTPGLLQARSEDLPGVNLHSLLLLLAGYRRHCRIDGESMQPTLFSGDFVIFRPLNCTKKISSVQEGSIVVANHPLNTPKLMIKRVHKISLEGIDLRGDNLNSSTDSRQFGLVRRENIKGVVESIFPLRNRNH